MDFYEKKNGAIFDLDSQANRFDYWPYCRLFDDRHFVQAHAVHYLDVLPVYDGPLEGLSGIR